MTHFWFKIISEIFVPALLPIATFIGLYIVPTKFKQHKMLEIDNKRNYVFECMKEFLYNIQAHTDAQKDHVLNNLKIILKNYNH